MSEELPVSEGQSQGVSPALPTETNDVVPSSGKRRSLRYLTRELSEEELSNPDSKTIIKLLIEAVERADDECENYKHYADDFHIADKKSEVLSQKLKSFHAVDIFYSIGLCLGGTAIGMFSSFWESNGSKGNLGLAMLGFGIILIIASIIAKIKMK